MSECCSELLVSRHYLYSFNVKLAQDEEQSDHLALHIYD